MSTALALAAVTAMIRELIGDAFVDHGVSTIVPNAQVTAVAPEEVRVGPGSRPGVNVHLYAVTANQGWRNVAQPSRDARGQRLTNPPLALDLHYLVAAYSSDDLQGEVLLGHALQRLHEVPLLERDTIRATLSRPDVLDGVLADAGLADQPELVKISPDTLTVEQISSLWSGFQSNHRPCAAYVASVVLVEADEPTVTPLPVLSRGEPAGPAGREEGVVVVTGTLVPHPTLTAIVPPEQQPVARLGDTLVLEGHHLDGTDHAVVFTSARLDERFELAPDSATTDRVEVTLPDDAAAGTDWAAGPWEVEVEVTAGEVKRTNRLPVTLAPTIPPPGVTAVLASGTATLTVPVSPEVRPEQAATLIVGSREVPADDHPASTDTLTFVLANAATGTFVVRLRVAGVESVAVDRTTSPPTFEPSQQVTIP